jgi:hypothetical protein
VEELKDKEDSQNGQLDEARLPHTLASHAIGVSDQASEG